MNQDFTHKADRAVQLERLLRERIAIIDGAMGTVIQRYKLEAALGWLKGFFMPRGAVPDTTRH